MKTILKVIQLFVLVQILIIVKPYSLDAQSIIVGEKGVSINSAFIKNENDVRKVLGQPNKIGVYPDSTKGQYWEYSDMGITVYFTNKQNLKKCNVSIMFKNFKGEILLGKTKLLPETHMYELLQFKELEFQPIEIEPIPDDPSKFGQFFDATCYGLNAMFIYNRPDFLGLLSLDVY